MSLLNLFRGQLDCGPLGNRGEHESYDRDQGDEQDQGFKETREPVRDLLRRRVGGQSREGEGLPRQRRDDPDDYAHHREENEILRKVSSVQLEGLRDDIAEAKLASDTMLRLHCHILSDWYEMPSHEYKEGNEIRTFELPMPSGAN